MSMDAQKLIALLKDRSLKLASAESCTGGLLAGFITQASGASEVFDCGIVAYSNEIKKRLLGVNSSDLEHFGAVSAQVAAGMARGVRDVSGADIGVGISGIAGPLSDNTSKPVGLIYIAVSSAENTVVEEFKTSFTGDVRAKNRSFALENAVRMIEEFLDYRENL